MSIARHPVWLPFKLLSSVHGPVRTTQEHFDVQQIKMKIISFYLTESHSEDWSRVMGLWLKDRVSNTEDTAGTSSRAESRPRAAWLLGGCCTGKKSPGADWRHWAGWSRTAGCVDGRRRQQLGPLLLWLSDTAGTDPACRPAARGNASTERRRLPDKHEPARLAPSSSASSACSGTSFWSEKRKKNLMSQRFLYE